MPQARAAHSVKTSSSLLEVENLAVGFHTGSGEVIAVKGVSFSLAPGEVLALVGESGSGKSVTALSLLKLLPYPQAYHPSGVVTLGGEEILTASPETLRSIRGKRISMVFQEPMTSLNPLHSIGKQISEVLLLHGRMTAKAAERRCLELLDRVELEGLKDRLDAYPHELSGGQRQRVMIAMALANEPEILIADEPTTALDVTVQAEVLKLLKELQKERGMAMLLITHDLGIVRHMAERVCVMQQGEIVESGTVEQVFSRPSHAYTKRLLGAVPSGRAVAVNAGAPLVLEGKQVSVQFPKKRSFWGKPSVFTTAVDAVDVTLKKGETLGIVGESGSGKTTLALALLRLLRSSGQINFQNQAIQGLKGEELRHMRRRMQIVFQDPFASLNPRMNVQQILEEGLRAHQLCDAAEGYENKISKVLKEVGLEAAMRHRYPHEFSGGQRQRIAIARALVLDPDYVVLDEPTSALDVSMQAQILELLKKLQKERGLSYLFISHDLRVIRAISHQVMVLKQGKIVETAPVEELFTNPREAYTKALIEAAFAYAV